jgi:MFS family permease
MIAAAVPPVVLARWTGRLADRVDSRVLLVGSGLAQAAVCAALAYVTPVAGIIALVAVLACGLAITQPTLSALVPAMVRREDLPKASAVGQTVSSVGLILAPVLAGLLMGQFGLRVPLLVDAASYLAIALAGGLIRTRRGAPVVVDPATPAPEPAAPWHLRADTLMWSLIILVGAVIAAVTAVNVADVFLVRGALHASTTVYGLVGGLWSVAMVGGAWLLARRRLDDSGMGRALLGLLLTTCAVIFGAALVPDVGWLLPLFLIGGATNGGENVAIGVLVARRVPDAYRGRAYAILGAVVNGANTLGYVLGGVLLTVLPVRVTVAAAGLFGVAVALAFAVPVLRATRGAARTGPDVSEATAAAGVASAG